MVDYGHKWRRSYYEVINNSVIESSCCQQTSCVCEEIQNQSTCAELMRMKRTGTCNAGYFCCQQRCSTCYEMCTKNCESPPCPNEQCSERDCGCECSRFITTQRCEVKCSQCFDIITMISYFDQHDENYAATILNQCTDSQLLNGRSCVERTLADNLPESKKMFWFQLSNPSLVTYSEPAYPDYKPSSGTQAAWAFEAISLAAGVTLFIIFIICNCDVINSKISLYCDPV